MTDLIQHPTCQLSDSQNSVVEWLWRRRQRGKVDPDPRLDSSVVGGEWTVDTGPVVKTHPAGMRTEYSRTN